MKKSFKCGTLGIFSVSESKVIAKLKKRAKSKNKNLHNFCRQKIVQKKVCLPKKIC